MKKQPINMWNCLGQNYVLECVLGGNVKTMYTKLFAFKCLISWLIKWRKDI
jgi:hypothetical protein